jgi:hypothetical protein
MKKAILLLISAGTLLTARAGVPEPGARIYGTIAINGALVAGANDAIVVEARRTPTGAPIASYRMGAKTNAGNFFALTLNAESATPLTGTNTVLLGSSVYLVVRDGNTDLDFQSFTLASRGMSARVNFGAVDTDGDGMSDDFETAYFGNSTNGLPNLDSDGDGRPNLREFLQGTNPNVADGRHPADIAPADDRIDLKEVTDYILAWKTGGSWPVEPAMNAPNIEDYVTRAGALWKGGEVYVFDNDPASTAPLWWTNPPTSGLIAGDVKSKGASKEKGDGAEIAAGPLAEITVVRTVGSAYAPNLPGPVSILATPSATTKAYAVVETPPIGWTVRNISNEGRWDAANRKIKWGPFFDNTVRTLAYDAVPGPTSSGPADFAGRGSFDGAGQIAQGPKRVWLNGVVTSAPSLVFAPISSKSLTVEITGEPGRRYEILVSHDLATWTADATVTLNSEGKFVAPVAGDAATTFLRVRSAD